jgi:cytochrome c-type biogenesis protein CcmH
MSFWIAAGLLALASVASLMFAVRRAGGRSAIAIFVALAIPGIALGTYSFVGAPEMPDQPYAQRGDAQARAEMQGLLGELTRRLEADPTRLDGWLLLARARMKVGDYTEAGEAFARARVLAPDNGEIAAELGEALIHAANGVVGTEARDALRFAIAKDPRDAKALFYLGHDAVARGDHAGAVQFWMNLIAVSPRGAPWIADIRMRITDAAAAGNIDLATVKATVAPEAPQPGPSAEDIRAMVEGLAARMEETPDDLTGWRMLARSWRVLGETEKADAADARVKSLEATQPNQP